MTWKIKNTTGAKVDRFGITIDQVVLPNGEEKTFSYLILLKGFVSSRLRRIKK